MSSFNPKQIRDAIARVPQQSNKSIQQVLENACRLKLDELIQACRQELRLRGSLEMGTEAAEQAARISARVVGKPLQEVIEIAFREVPAKPEEWQVIDLIGKRPGISYKEVRAVYGKDDLALVIGHLIYNRFGYFRPMLADQIQSNLLLERDQSTSSVCYRLRPETIAAFRALGLLETPT